MYSPIDRRAVFVFVSSALLACPPGASAQPPDDEIEWLETNSILGQAREAARAVSGSGEQWRRPYAEPRTAELVKTASVWLFEYPGSVITRPGESVIAAWADERRWDAYRRLGVTLFRTAPLKLSGGVRGRELTPTTDGWFDPISLTIDPSLGTEEEYVRLARVAREHGALVGGDLIPLHTGTGFDFRLATLAYKDYPGMYTMVEVAEDDWGLLPEVAGERAVAHVPKDAAKALTEKGYIPGLINSNDADPEAQDWSGWSATGEVVGIDGKARRWVYLHYFKPGQPTLNWLDPSMAAPRAVAGDLTRSVHQHGVRLLRLDAVPFLGIEKQPGEELTWHYKHPLSPQRTRELAQLARKLGGWTFHELNLPAGELSDFTENGPDISYDFVTRAQTVHSLLTRDAATLRQAHGFLLEEGVPAGALFHDLQNHDEITYQLMELDARGDQMLTLAGKQVTGRELKERMLREMRRKVGDGFGYTRLYRTQNDGLATTFAGLVAASLGIEDPYRATAEQVGQIRKGHLLLAHANAMQPGVFGLSTWDLVGALPVPEETVASHVEGGDYRWINRGGVDLMGDAPKVSESAFGLPRAEALYGPLPDQLRDPESFAARLRLMLAARERHQLAEGVILATPEPTDTAVCLIVMRLPAGALAVTALNFGDAEVTEAVDLSPHADPDSGDMAGRGVSDIVREAAAGRLSERGVLKIELSPWEGRTLVVE